MDHNERDTFVCVSGQPSHLVKVKIFASSKILQKEKSEYAHDKPEGVMLTRFSNYHRNSSQRKLTGSSDGV